MRNPHTSQHLILPLGVSDSHAYPWEMSGDVFQHKLDAIYGDLPLTISCADDMIIWGEKDDLSDHDAALDKFLQVTRNMGYV